MDFLFNWLAYLPVFLGTLLLIYLPGLLPTFFIGFRGFTCFVIAPAFSAVTLTITAILLSQIGIWWARWSNLKASILLCIIIWITNEVIHRKNGGTKRKQSIRETFSSHLITGFKKNKFNNKFSWLISAFLIGFVSVSYFLTKSIYNPTNPAFRWDSVFHQDVIRYIMDTGSASPLTIKSLLDEWNTFYPAVFHGFASEVVLLTGTTIPVAYNMVTFVFCAVIWVSSMLYLLYTLFPTQKTVWLVGSIITAGFPIYPYYQLGTSGVVPNIIAYAFLPSALALIFKIVRPTKNDSLTLIQKYIALFIVTLGASLTHPSAAFSILVISIGLIIEYFIKLYKRASTDKNKKITLLAITLSILLTAAVWHKFSIIFSRNQATLSFPEALWKGITSNFLTQDFWQPLLAILTLLGFILATIIKKWRFIAIGYSATLLLYLLAVSFPDSALRTEITGIWYSSASRIITLLVPLAVVLICILLSELLTKFPKKIYSISCIAALIAALSTFTPAMMSLTGYIYKQGYKIDDAQPLMDMDKYTFLLRLNSILPDKKGVIANNPYNGGQFAYILTARPVLFPYQGEEFKNPSEKLIAQKLNQAATDPEVCKAVKNRKVKYALDFGEDYMKNEKIDQPNVPSGTDYPGLTNLENAPGFQQIGHYGTVKLYKITACQT